MIEVYFIISISIIILLFTVHGNKLKTVWLLCFLFSSSTYLFAQEVKPVDTIKSGNGSPKITPIDTIIPGNGSPKEQIKEIKEEKVKLLSDSAGTEPKKSSLIDTTIQNKYGDLLNDDIMYNKKYPAWKPFLGVIGNNVSAWALDRFIYNYDYSHVNLKTWRSNLQNGWEWDDDPFGINFIGHPYSGSMYFNSARSRGYSFVQSFPFVVAGSLMWEYFGENSRPSYNDLINTPINGIFLGEIFYRLSSNILDDRTTGGGRVFREVLAGLIDPVRGFNRLLQGKSFRITKKEVYQKEPINITLLAGLHKVNLNNNTVFSEGPNDALINMQLDYGNPFEIIARKPFDFFRLRTAFSFGAGRTGRKIVDNVTGYGILFGSNTHSGKLSMLYGAFQYYDYWDNKAFELGAIGFGGGLSTKYSISKTVNFYNNAHLAIVPLAGNSTRFGPDTSKVRDYTYNNGLEGKFESTLNLGKYLSASLAYHYYIIHTTVGPAGNNYINIINPRITVNLYKNISIGFEHFVYYDDRYLKNFAAIHSSRTEQKLFLSIFLEDPQRKGRYN